MYDEALKIDAKSALAYNNKGWYSIIKCKNRNFVSKVK